MKVIDLLNKIANGEEVPEFIEIENKFTNENEMLFACTENIFHCLDNRELNLNSIISPIEEKEEDKEIEQIKICVGSDTYLVDKINELIDAVNELKKGK